MRNKTWQKKTGKRKTSPAKGHLTPKALALPPNTEPQNLPSQRSDPPYPDYDKAIAVYVGNDDPIGRLPPLDAIGTSSSLLYERIANRLAKENYFEVENDSAEMLAKLERGITAFLPVDTILFRARIGIAKRFMCMDGDWTSNTIFQPYMGPEIGARPPEPWRRFISLSVHRRNDGRRGGLPSSGAPRLARVLPQLEGTPAGGFWRD